MPSVDKWPFKVTLISSDTAHVEMLESQEEISLDAVKKLTHKLGEIGNHKKLNVIVEILNFNTISKEARKYSASEESQIYTKANAIIVKSLAMRIGSNFFININKPVTPTKVFNKIDEALKWFNEI